MNIVIRVDATSQMGTGHLMRCLALGQGVKDRGGKVVFVTYCESKRLLERLKKENFKLYTLREISKIEDLRELLKKENPDWVVLDGYHFDGDYQRAIKDGGYKLLYIDDYAHLEHYYADIILNQNYGAEKFSYNAEPHTRLLLGTEYVLLRQEFLEYADFIREIPDVAHKVLITLGGADPENNTLKVLKAVNLVRVPLEVKVVIGAGNPYYESAKSEAGISTHKVEILRTVENMAPLMAWADIAMSAGGTTVWELAFIGLPSILCIVATNQESAVNSLARDGIFQSLGWIKNETNEGISNILTEVINNKAERERMSQRARELSDGKGIYRIINTMDKTTNNINDLMATLHGDIDFGEVRFVNFVNLSDEEIEMVRQWRNSDDIRRWMFTDHIISKEEHSHFIEDLKRHDTNFYWLVKQEDKPVGVCSCQNVDFRGRSGYLGIYSVEKGAGRMIIDHLLRLWFQHIKMHILKCEVVEGNRHAYNFYKTVGFTEEDTTRFILEGNTSNRVISMFMMRKGEKISETSCRDR